MKNFRKLYFRNASGQRIDLNGKSNILASELVGFGFTLSPVFADLKRGFFASTSDDSEPQAAPGFKLNFVGSEPYKDYQALANWLAASDGLQLVYKPWDGGTEFLRDIQISYMSKGEKNSLGWLVVPASFACLTPWYRPSPTELKLRSGTDTIMRFPFRFTKDLRFGSASASGYTGTISPAGQVPGAILLRYHGAISCPRIRLVGKDSGTTYGICSVDAEFAAGETFELSTVPTDSHVYKILPGGEIVDLLDDLDISTEPYFRLPINEPCTISMESDSSFTGTAELLVYYFFRTV